MSIFIYGLVDPISGQLRYVGKTNNLANRLYDHLVAARKGRQRRDNWIKGLVRRDLTPEMLVLEETSPSEWIEAERFWISYFRMIGANLTNLTPGGEGVVGPKSAEHRAKIAATLTGKPSWNKGKPWSKEARKKLGDAQRGKSRGPQSEEHKRKLSEVRRRVLAEGRGKTVISAERKLQAGERLRSYNESRVSS